MKLIEGTNKDEPVHLPFDAAMAGLASGAYTSAEVGDEADLPAAADQVAAAEAPADAKASGKKAAG